MKQRNEHPSQINNTGQLDRSDIIFSYLPLSLFFHSVFLTLCCNCLPVKVSGSRALGTKWEVSLLALGSALFEGPIFFLKKILENLKIPYKNCTQIFVLHMYMHTH